MKNRISGLNAIRCSSVLINVNSYTHGKEINNVNTDWFQAVVWKPANLEGAAAASRKETKYGCAGHCHCAPKTVVLGRTGSGLLPNSSGLSFVHTVRCKEMPSAGVQLESHPSQAQRFRTLKDF